MNEHQQQHMHTDKTHNSIPCRAHIACLVNRNSDKRCDLPSKLWLYMYGTIAIDCDLRNARLSLCIASSRCVLLCFDVACCVQVCCPCDWMRAHRQVSEALNTHGVRASH